MSKMTDTRKGAIARALAHHEMAGRIEFASCPYVGRPRWRIRPAGQDYLDLTWAEAEALCVGLAVAEAETRRMRAREVGA